MTPAPVDIEHFRRRVIRDALDDGMAATWERRAAMFQQARPRPEDFPGRATATELVEADRRCVATAALCRHRATLGLSEHDLGLLDVVLGEVAA